MYCSKVCSLNASRRFSACLSCGESFQNRAHGKNRLPKRYCSFDCAWRAMVGRTRVDPLQTIQNNTIPEPNTGCLLWMGSVNNKGYGTMGGGHTRIRRGYVHRIHWILIKGAIPAGMHLLHSCDTPRCCALEHLRIGTAKENAQDSLARGRNFWAAKTRCPRGHALDKVYKSETRYFRYCGTCDNLRGRRKRAEKRCLKSKTS